MRVHWLRQRERASCSIATMLAIGVAACSPIEKLDAVPQKLDPPALPRLELVITNFCADDGRDDGTELEDFYTRNLSAHITPDAVLTDFDRDGVPDAYESGEIGKKFGLNPGKRDTNDDGYHDLAVFRAGMTAIAQEYLKYRYCADLKARSSADLLTDCEKGLLFGLDPKKADNSSVGLLDWFKVLSGMNPLDSANTYLNTAGDAEDNVTKAKLGVPIDASANAFVRSFTPTYKIEKTLARGGAAGGARCAQPLKLTASNIVIAPTANANLVMTFLNRRQPGGQREFALCCTMVDPKYTGGKTIEIDWARHAKDDLKQLKCPCPDLDTFEGGSNG